MSEVKKQLTDSYAARVPHIVKMLLGKAAVYREQVRKESDLDLIYMGSSYFYAAFRLTEIMQDRVARQKLFFDCGFNLINWMDEPPPPVSR